jgi:hypothetical protein
MRFSCKGAGWADSRRSIGEGAHESNDFLHERVLVITRPGISSHFALGHAYLGYGICPRWPSKVAEVGLRVSGTAFDESGHARD